MLTERDSLLVTSHEKEPFTKTYDGMQYGFPPELTVHVPFEVVRLHWGDPRSGEGKTTAVSPDGRTKIQINSRADERGRLETLYGVNAEILRRMQDARGTGKGPKPVTLQDMAPNVTVSQLDGSPIDTVVSDPTGNNPVAIPVDVSSPEALEARVKQMQRDLDTLMEAQRAAAANPQDGADTTADGPPSSWPGQGGAPPAK